MSIYACLPGIDDDSPCGEPWRYRGSHILPAETDPRGGAIDLAVIPSHITRDGRDDRPEDGRPWPWLRLAVLGDEPTVVINPAQARELARQLTEWADDAEPAHEGGHTDASGATTGQRGPEPAGDANGPHTGAQRFELPTVIHRTPDQLRTQRAQLIASTGMTEDQLRERAERYLLDTEDQLAWNTVEGIDYLLDQPDDGGRPPC